MASLGRLPNGTPLYGVGGERGALQGGLNLSMSPMQGSAGRGGGYGGGGGGAVGIPQGYKTKQLDPFIELDEPTKHAMGLASQKQNFEQQKFQTVWGALSGMLNRFGSGNPFQIGGSAGAGTPINTNPIWNQQQIGQQVNAARASNDRQTAGNIKSARESVAGRGFGANSPLAMALENQSRMQGMARNAEASREIPFQAAGANAEHVLKAQTAQANQYQQLAALDVERMRPYFNLQNSLLGAISGML